MRIIIGTYKNTKYTFNTGSRRITVYSFPWKFDIDTIKLISNNTGLNNSNVGYIIGAPTITKYTVSYASPVTTLTVGTATSGGSVTAGTHSYKVTYVYDTGDESIGSSTSTQINVIGGTQTVPLTNIPIGPTGVVQRNIYRTAAGDTGSYLLLTSIADNTTTTFSDTIADASLTTTIPTSSNVYNIDYSTSLPTLLTNDKLLIDVEIPDPTVDTTFDAIKTIPQVMSELPPHDPEVAIISETNLAVNANPYWREIPQSSWRNLIGQIKATCSTTSTTFQLFATLDPSAVTPTDNATGPSADWVNITKQIFGTDSAYNSTNNNIVVPTTGTYLSLKNWSNDSDKLPMMVNRFLLAITVANATNSFQVNIRKY